MSPEDRREAGPVAALDAAPDPRRHVKAAVRRLQAYSLAATEIPVKLNQNESPRDAPAELKRRVLEAALARDWNRYPGFAPVALVERLSSFCDWPPDGILAGNGSNELIEALLRVTVGPGTRVVVPQPTFSLYALLVRILGGEVIEVPLGAAFEYDAAELSRVRRELRVPVTIVGSPNNPTGSVLDPDAIDGLCAEFDGLVVVDEAYREFAGQTVAPLLARHPNLVVLRTFSKAFGLAALRVGYLLAAPALVREIAKARLPYSLDVVAEAAAVAALDAWPEVQRRVDETVAAREALWEELQRIPGVRAYPSRANFVLFELAQGDPRGVFEALVAHGVLVRDVSASARLGRCLRVSVGTEAENAQFLAALRQVLEARRFGRG